MRNKLQILFTVFFLFLLTIDCTQLFSASISRFEVISDNDLDALAKTINSDIINKLDSVFNKYAVEGFSGSVLVACNGHELFTRNNGFSNWTTLADIDENSIFQLASASKQFTAMSIMLLNQEGKIDLDGKLTDYIPELPYKNITIRNLLNHTSGLPDYVSFLSSNWHNKGGNPTNEDVIKIMAARKYKLKFVPGSRFVYSNTGYMVLATIVERLSGERFPEFVKKHIFDPLGMTHSYIHTTTIGVDSVHMNTMVSGHKGHYVIPMSICDGPVGDKGVYSTVEDLYKWDKALEENKLIPANLEEEEFTPGHTNQGSEVPYGFGYRLRLSPWGRLVYHNGLWGGFKSSFLRYIDAQTTVIGLNNTNSKLLHPLVEDLSKIINDAQKDRFTDNIIFSLLKSDSDSIGDKIKNIVKSNTASQINPKKLKWAID
ncbi:MAG: serine hydrolase domain-containing protein, partial [Bacteroidota bacterium]|nr:serine hydrolase domain-containing protein [Bacteroidota bacterium]